MSAPTQITVGAHGKKIVFMAGKHETDVSVRGDAMLLDVATLETRLLYVATNGIYCVGNL